MNQLPLEVLKALMQANPMTQAQNSGEPNVMDQSTMQYPPQYYNPTMGAGGIQGQAGSPSGPTKPNHYMNPFMINLMRGIFAGQ